jgi:outer membrane lipoprotein SlyB
VGGAVKVENSNGAIAVSGLRGNGCHPVALCTNFSTIRVSVPESSSYSVNARTSFGSIRSALPVTTNGTNENTLVGTIGRGGCQLELVNANGNITIEKE